MDDGVYVSNCSTTSQQSREHRLATTRSVSRDAERQRSGALDVGGLTMSKSFVKWRFLPRHVAPCRIHFFLFKVPMIANHVIFGAYGFWLPNDPRGSWSDFVGSWELFRYGRTTKTDETRSVAARPHNRQLRLEAKEALKRPPVEFTKNQINSAAAGFAEYATRSGLTIFACAVMPDHVHCVLARHRLEPEQLVIQLKGAATRQLADDGLHPFPTEGRPEKCFARGEWIVFLDYDEDVRRAIGYVELNPEKEGLPRQRWPFVVEFKP